MTASRLVSLAAAAALLAGCSAGATSDSPTSAAPPATSAPTAAEQLTDADACAQANALFAETLPDGVATDDGAAWNEYALGLQDLAGRTAGAVSGALTGLGAAATVTSGQITAGMPALTATEVYDQALPALIEVCDAAGAPLE